MDAVIEFANNGGRVLGICNGFQILCESGLLPGVLLRNTNMKYNCKNVYLKTITKDSELTRGLKTDTTLKIPIAHGDGRYYCDDATLKLLKKNNQILFKYCNENGVVSPESNPNGSIENIAAICNEKRNVFGMMPHPERASEADLGNQDGLILFESLMNRIAETV
jgi:phosphoribosylformylglycinamidine synthase